MTFELADQRVVVTAGGSGIGRAIVERFAGAGAQVWTCDIDAAALGEVTRAEGIDGVVADVGSTASVDSFMTAALSALGGIDVLVNNAGIAGPGGGVETVDPEDVTRTLDVDVTSMFRTSRHAVPVMKAQGSGSIVNISSTAGLHGFPNRSPYAAAKWAVIGLTKTMAMELGEYGIRVNAICPGSINGPRMEHVIALEAEASGRAIEDVRAGMHAQASMRTFVDAEEIAQTIAFLASPLAARISGQALSIDGHTETLRS
ncbi:MAG: 3-ketoacyl-ACP reductase [Acidimicrobiales bacterium]|nr:MAG: 3-ketoacyl-ACP reductase [Acidimicrobiales bacterium]